MNDERITKAIEALRNATRTLRRPANGDAAKALHHTALAYAAARNALRLLAAAYRDGLQIARAEIDEADKIGGDGGNA